MPAEFEEGWFAHTPAWHSLGEVKDERPTTWEQAREGYLDWEPIAQPIYRNAAQAESDSFAGLLTPVDGYRLITRSDNGSVLSVQEDSYAVIGNGEFGGIIEYAMGVDLPGMPKLQFDALCVLKEGRLVVATLYLEQPMSIPGDPSSMYPLMAFWTRHDGMGGMKGGATTVRVVCANTQAMAESQMDSHGFVFNIRHTKNWAERLGDARGSIITALAGVDTWKQMATGLAEKAVSEDDVRWFLDKWLPYSTDMTSIQQYNVGKKRAAFRAAYDSETCDRIAGTAWGVLQAAIEAADHYFPAHSMETRTARILVHGDEYKSRALKYAKAFSGSAL